jgi:hypothetical protein
LIAAGRPQHRNDPSGWRDLALETIAIVGVAFKDARSVADAVWPCRKSIARAAQLANQDVRVLCCSGELSKIAVSRISALLPEPFGPESLELTSQWPAWRDRPPVRVKQLIDVRQKR